MRRSRTLFAVLISGLLGVSAVSAQESAQVKEVVKGNNTFALDLYGQLAREDGNLFFSPYSISNALAMTYEGARGKTAEQMAQTLHFSLGQAKLGPAFADLIGTLNDPKAKRKYRLEVANALWGQKGFGFLPDFIKTTDRYYGAGFQELNFRTDSEQARQTINRWVEDKTNDKIKELLKPGVLDSSTRMVLTNAIYFKAAWAEAFSERMTRKAVFHAPGGKTKVDMMQRSETLRYTETDALQMVEVPYERGELSMIVMLPRPGHDLAEVEKMLTPANLENWRGKEQRYMVNLKLPRFKTTAEFSLKKVLESMGMPLAFSGQADFSGMSKEAELQIGAVIHKAFIDVHEKGTEAAAATAVTIRVTSALPVAKRVDFVADHPFVYLIRENRTGSILFAGRLVNP